MTLTVENVDWNKASSKLKQLREKVFVYEWRIPKEYEFDKYDQEAAHVLVLDETGSAIATGRLTPNGEIGRIAVIPKYRGPEVYRTLLNALLRKANRIGLQTVYMQCELDGVDHFQQQGFVPFGSVYMDAGVARQKMACSLEDFSLSRIELTH